MWGGRGLNGLSWGQRERHLRCKFSCIVSENICRFPTFPSFFPNFFHRFENIFRSCCPSENRPTKTPSLIYGMLLDRAGLGARSAARPLRVVAQPGWNCVGKSLEEDGPVNPTLGPAAISTAVFIGVLNPTRGWTFPHLDRVSVGNSGQLYFWWKKSSGGKSELVNLSTTCLTRSVSITSEATSRDDTTRDTGRGD